MGVPVKNDFPFIPAVGSPAFKPQEERGVYNGVTFEERERNRKERETTGISNEGQRQIDNRLAAVAAEMNAEKEPLPSEIRVAFAIGKLLREILQPEEQRVLVKSLTRGPRIERNADAALYLASEAIRTLPERHWASVLSLLQQGGR